MVKFLNNQLSIIRFCLSGLRLSSLAVLICALFILNSPKLALGFEESQVKAVFLYNITKFVAWPENRNAKKNFYIVLLGDNPFNDQLKEVIKGEKIQGKSIDLQHYSDHSEIDWQNTDLLFISDDNPEILHVIKEDTQNNNVLTISDTKGFCSYGGMVNLFTVGSRIKIEINREEVKKGGLTISAQLLKLARIITTQERVN